MALFIKARDLEETEIDAELAEKPITDPEVRRAFKACLKQYIFNAIVLMVGMALAQEYLSPYVWYYLGNFVYSIFNLLTSRGCWILCLIINSLPLVDYFLYKNGNTHLFKRSSIIDLAVSMRKEK